MEVLMTVFRAIDLFFMTVTIALGSLLLSFNIDFPPLTAYVPKEAPSAITAPITSTTVSINATTTKPVSKPATVKATPASLPLAPAPAPTTQTTKPVAIDFEKINADTRAALVNILCIARSGSGVGSVSGSGAIIDSRGIILTNAHIAQFFLLKDYPTEDSVECTIRTGSPAEPRYHAELLYLPPAWVDANAAQLKAEKPLGTGEHDYAFLRITSTTNPNNSLPASFPSISITTEDPNIGEDVLLAAYPAGFLDGATIERDLYITSAFTVVQKLFTFDQNGFIDVISIGGTIVSQGGSSGGAVVRGKDGKIISLISTATAGATTSDRDLRAIMLSHINRSLTQQGKGSIENLLSTNPTEEALNFATNIAPNERQKLISVLAGN